MRRGNSRKRLSDPYEITVSVKLSSSQKRTLQMFVEKFSLLHEGEAIRMAIERYMAKYVDDQTPDEPKDFHRQVPAAFVTQAVTSIKQPTMKPQPEKQVKLIVSEPGVLDKYARPSYDDRQRIKLEQAAMSQPMAASDDAMTPPSVAISQQGKEEEESLNDKIKRNHMPSTGGEAEPDKWSSDR